MVPGPAATAALETSWKCKLFGSPDLQDLWRWGLAVCVFTSPPRHSHSSLRTTELGKQESIKEGNE